MPNQNIAAFTEIEAPASGEYVRFISVNRHTDGSVEIMSRENDGKTFVCISLTPSQWAAFRQEIIERG